ncbi:MAG: c-type cytochrome [Oligoflexia bacterium]
MSEHQQHDKHEHPILADKTALGVLGALLVLTVVTVAVSRVDLGIFNFTVALLIAVVKATVVGMWFMGLKYDTKENTLIFVSSFLFLAIFIVLTATDLLFRGEVYVKKGELEARAAGGKSRFKKAWVSTPELLAHGKAQYEQQCASCHGVGGNGQGPAAAGLNPKPRNFTAGDGWKNGRKPTAVFKTLTQGLGQMPVFSSLPADDRWALAHYVLSMGPAAEKDTASDFAALKIDPTQDQAGEEQKKSISIDLAIQRLAVPETARAGG